MTTETTKPADSAPNGASGGSAAGAADFDALIREFTEGTKPDAKPTADVSKVLTSLKPVIEFASTELGERHKKSTQEDIEAAINFCKEEEAVKDIPPKVIRGMLEGYASEHEEFAQAFQNRGKDKAAWQAQLAAARKSVAEDLKPLGAAGTRILSDVAAARAAVSGEGNNPPPNAGEPSPDEMFRMSERDFRALLEKDLRNAR